jgi:hypothetical protein
MVLLLFLMACADPVPVAQRACEALPGLATDPAGLQLLAPVLATVDYDALAAAQPTRGLELLGSDGLAALRGKVECTVGLVEGAGQGRWAVDLERSLPEVLPDGSLGEVKTTALSWQAVKTKDGVRVETGLAGAAIMRASAQQAYEEGDLRRYSSSWRAIAKKFPDPLIAVDIAHAEGLFERDEYRTKIRGKPVAVDDAAGTLKAELSNTGEREVVQLEVRVEFGVGDQTASQTANVDELGAGSTATVEVDIPEGADGKVHIEVVHLELVP